MPPALQTPTGWGEGPLAMALNGANEPSRTLLLAALLRQAQHCQVEVSEGANGLSAVQLRMELTPAALAGVLQSGPSPQALAALIGLASI